jgi:rhodanese-related sulfurtransferase
MKPKKMKNKSISALIILLSITSLLQGQNLSLTIKEFAQLLNTSQHPQILDARSPEEFAINHLKNAININLKDSAGTEKIISTLNPKYPTFTYSINNGRSIALAKKLVKKGFENVNELPGGLGNWVGAGNPIVTLSKNGLSITNDQFKQLTASNELVLVDYGSKFCGTCRKTALALDSIENQHASNLKIVRIEFDSNPELVKAQKIVALPSLVLYKNGIEIWNNKGYINYKNLLTSIETKSKLLANK